MSTFGKYKKEKHSTRHQYHHANTYCIIYKIIFRVGSLVLMLSTGKIRCNSDSLTNTHCISLTLVTTWRDVGLWV